MLIKNKLIFDERFITAFSKLMTRPMPAKQCLEVSASLDELTGQHKILQRTRRAIVEKYCKKNEEGLVVEDIEGNIVFDTDEQKNKCKEELNEIYDEEIDISLTKRIKIFEDEIITPIETFLLTDVIDVVDQLPRPQGARHES